jgi:hypothetical protein
MDSIGQNYDLFRRDLAEKSKEHPFVARINTWEQESITKIQKAAETARTELQKVLDNIKSDLESSVAKTVEEIKVSRDSNDFTENEFQRWIIQLNELRQAFESPCNVSIENDKDDETVISLIKLCILSQPSSPPITEAISEDHFSSNVGKRSFFLNEKFDSRTDAKLSNNNLIATCCPKYGSSGAIVYGFNSYSTGIYDISFQIEKKGLSRLFFGICSASKKRVDIISSGCDNSVYGWWDINSAVVNGTRQESNNEQIISMGDRVVLTLDCAHEQIQLYHIRENRLAELSVDLKKCPFPWKFIVKLTANYDCVRIR